MRLLSIYLGVACLCGLFGLGLVMLVLWCYILAITLVVGWLCFCLILVCVDMVWHCCLDGCSLLP